MGQAERVLAPSISPLHFFGAEIRRMRAERDWSQAELGAAVISSKDLVRRIETAERFPTQEFVGRCDEILECRGYLGRLWPMLERERLLQLGRDGHRSRTAFNGDIADRPVLDWILSDSRSLDPALSESAISKVDNRSFDRELQRLRQLDHTHGAGQFYDVVTGSLGQVQWAEPQTAIGFLELAGYEAVDLGADGAAQRHYLRALEVATKAGERLYGGYLIAVSLAHLALHCGEPQQAARLATAALHGTASIATPATRAAFRTVLARAHARMGNERECMAALAKAEQDVAHSRPDEEPPYIRYFTEADLADERAHAFFDLGLDRLSQDEAKSAIATIAPTRIRRLAIDTALLSSSLARAKAVEEACAVGMRAIDYTSATGSFRSVHRVMMMLAHLQPHISVVEVRELFDYANLSLPLAVPVMLSRQ